MRKTRRQKITADLHRKLYKLQSQEASSFEKEAPKTETIIEKVSPALLIDSQKYSYLIADISKTAIVTGAILVAQLIFFSILKMHLLKIPGINY